MYLENADFVSDKCACMGPYKIQAHLIKCAYNWMGPSFPARPVAVMTSLAWQAQQSRHGSQASYSRCRLIG